MSRKTGKPKALERTDEDSELHEQSLSDFVKEMFPPTKTEEGEEIASATAEQQQGLPNLETLKQMFKTKSAAIRYLHNLGPEIGYPQGTPAKLIAKHLGIRPQHARNVILAPLKRGPNEDWRPKTEPKGLQTKEGFDHTKDDQND